MTHPGKMNYREMASVTLEDRHRLIISNERQPMVRATFDELEKRFAAEAWKAEQKAVAPKKTGRTSETVVVLDEFMAKLIEEGLAAVKDLKVKMAGYQTEVTTSLSS